MLGERAAQLAGTMSGRRAADAGDRPRADDAPRLLILDEPSLGLSPKFVDIVFAELTALHGEGLTIVMVEQKASRALGVSDSAMSCTWARSRSPTGRRAAVDDKVKRAYLGELPPELEPSASPRRTPDEHHAEASTAAPQAPRAGRARRHPRPRRATFIAGPFCSTQLAEFGAEVIKLELPVVGDAAAQVRHPDADRGDSLPWLQETRNKKSLTLDLRKPEGAELLQAPGPQGRRAGRELPARHAREVGPRLGRRCRKRTAS